MKDNSQTYSQDRQLSHSQKQQSTQHSSRSIQSTESSPSTEQSKKSEPSTLNISDMTREVLVSLGESGRPVGESAPNAKYTDSEIDLVFLLREQGYFYREISEMLDMPVRTIRTVLDGTRRNKAVVGWKKLQRKAKK